MIELACSEVVFHFNKGHIQDPTIPMWVLKAKGKSYYVHHVDCEVPWSTKETPDNPHTKGAIKVKNVLLEIDDNNHALIKKSTPEDRERVGNAEKGITRAIMSSAVPTMQETIARLEVPIGPYKNMGGLCTTTWCVFDVYGAQNWLLLMLSRPETCNIRELKANEVYYKLYEKHKYSEQSYIHTDEENDEEGDDDDDENDNGS